MTSPSTQARLTLQDAFERFSTTVNPDDKRLFNNTKLKDVREEAIRIEKQLRARRTQRNLARLQPFLGGLEHYSKVVEVLCNGTPYLSWIWAPVKLMLMIMVDSLSAFEKLIEAYGKIADMMPRLDRLSSALENDPNFQNILALVYSDILEFHQCAYKFVRKSSWILCFRSLWAGFESRFKNILRNLAYHTDLLDREAGAADIAGAIKHSKEQTQQWEQQEREWLAVKVRAVYAWLDANSALTQDMFHKHNEVCLPGSCDWFLKHTHVQAWMKDGSQTSLLWLWGKPGAGKSVICSSLIQHAKQESANVFYFFCSYLARTDQGASYVLRILVSQILHEHQHLAVYVHDTYFQSKPVPSRKALLALLPDLLQGLGSARFIIDGLDEWDVSEQRLLLKDLDQIRSIDSSICSCKVFLSCQPVVEVWRNMKKKRRGTTIMSLSDFQEESALNLSIGRFVEDRLRDIPDHIDDLDPNATILAQVKQSLLAKCNGMFLWVRLVLDSLNKVYSPAELRRVVNDLPADLEDLYIEILGRVCQSHDLDYYGGVPRIFSWLCSTQRPLHKNELLQGLVAHRSASDRGIEDVPIAQLLDHCKPFIEERPDSTIAFVHFSVKEFFLKSKPTNVVSSLQGQHDMSLSCVYTVIHGLELLSVDTILPDHLARIARGTYRLLPYALEFWIEHCMLYAEQSGGSHVTKTLLDLLQQLCDRHGQYESEFSLARNISTSNPEEDRLDSRLALIDRWPAHHLMRSVLQARFAASQSQCESGEEVEAFLLQHDPTVFSKLAAQFNKAVIQLLSQDEVENIPEPVLKAFHQSYATTAFRCRYIGCPHRSVGFLNHGMRIQHEASHCQRVYCKIEACSYSRIGFSNRARLNKHVRDYHAEQQSLLVPPKLRLSKKIAESDGDDQELSFIAALRWQIPVGLSPEVNIRSFPSLLNISRIQSHTGLESKDLQELIDFAAWRLLESPELVPRLDNYPLMWDILSPQVQILCVDANWTWKQTKSWMNEQLGVTGITMAGILRVQLVLYAESLNVSLVRLPDISQLLATTTDELPWDTDLLGESNFSLDSNSAQQKRTLPDSQEIKARMDDPARYRAFRQLIEEVEWSIPARPFIKLPQGLRHLLEQKLKEEIDNLKKVEQALHIFHVTYEGSDAEDVVRQVAKARALVFAEIDEKDGTLHDQVTLTVEEFKAHLRTMTNFVDKLITKILRINEPSNTLIPWWTEV